MAREPITLESVEMGYHRPILLGVSFTFEPGSAYVLTGENSIGKSTFLKTVAGILTPLSGRVFPTVQADTWALNGISAGIMIQEELGVFEEYSVADVLRRLLPRRRPGSLLNLPHTVQRLSDLIGIDQSLFTKPFRQLSGGQRRLAGTAIALAGSPECVILDEIFGGLDSQTRNGLAKNLKGYAASQRSIVLVADHDIDSASDAGFICVSLGQWHSNGD